MSDAPPPRPPAPRPRRTGGGGGDGRRRDRDRAVSDVVAFVFTFSIIITSVGVVSAVGFSVLEDVQGDEQALNAQRGFQTLSESLNEIDRTNVPGRAGEISLNQGTLQVRSEGDGSTIGVEVAETTGGSIQYDTTVDVGTLVYTSQQDDTRLALETGAAIRRDDNADQGIVVSRPNFVCRTDDAEYALVSVVTMVSDSNTRGGEGTVQINARERSSSVPFTQDGDFTVTVDYSGSDYPQAWETYFQRNGDWTNVGSGTAECDVDGRAIVRLTTLDVELVS